MSYGEELRALVGHRALINVGAGVLLLDDQERLLLLLRNDNGQWGIPGGGMEPGERLEETARRETREETGLELGELAMLEVFSGPALFYRYPNGDEVYNVSAVYVARDYHGALRMDDGGHRKARWFALGELRQLLEQAEPVSPPVRPVLTAFLNWHMSKGEQRHDPPAG
jgi:8-oxo-dGTP pyrophosphatase MutT (NUDIX family)